MFCKHVSDNVWLSEEHDNRLVEITYEFIPNQYDVSSSASEMDDMMCDHSVCMRICVCVRVCVRDH